MDQELKTYLDDLRNDLMEQIVESRRHAEQLNQETRELAQQWNQETRELAQQWNQEMGILFESLREDVRLVAEGVTTVRDQLGRMLSNHEDRITHLEQYLPRQTL